MSHEQSETIQNKNGKWINVYGQKTPQAGQQLPNTREYNTVDEAVKDAQARSRNFSHMNRTSQDLKTWVKPGEEY